MKKSNFKKILLSLLAICFIITPVAFADNEINGEIISPMAVGQVVKDSYWIAQESQNKSSWTNVDSSTEYKTLYPPTGYYYIQDGSPKKYYSLPKWSDDEQVWVRWITWTYSYKLAPL